MQSYKWHFGDGQTNNNSQTPAKTYNDFGVYAIKLVVQYTGGCTDSLIKPVTIVNVTGLCDSIKITGPNKVCNKKDTLTYSFDRSQNCTPQYTLLIDNAFADIVSQTATSVSLVFKQNGITSVKMAFDNGCKTVIDSIDVTIKLSPTSLNLGPDISICKDTLIKLNAKSGFDFYLWQDGSADSTYTITNAGNYFVQAQNFCGVQFKDTFRLVASLIDAFKASPMNTSVCKGDSIQFNAFGGTQYSWQPAGNFNNSNISSPKAFIGNSQTVIVQISDALCSRDTIIFIPVLARDKAEIVINKRNDVNCELDSTLLIASGGISYNWSPNTYICRTFNNQITVKPPQTTTYYLHSRDVGGCTALDSVTVYFFKEGKQKLFIPNGFIPNNDGLNDVFKPTFTGPAVKFDFKIFNRWGQLIFQTSTPGKGWDGVFKSMAQPNGVYVTTLLRKEAVNGRFERKGTFVLNK
ncbi:MAG: gliding motility-associated C-terminal domain-containing protein [Bacteroidota bacterium]|nr:gliding motility-associated C-terminal domain-containing protein [Bacteroidota bacterium]